MGTILLPAKNIDRPLGAQGESGQCHGFSGQIQLRAANLNKLNKA